MRNFEEASILKKGELKYDLTGQRFGMLVVIGPTEMRRSRKILWECKCDCGNTHYTMGYLLKNGDVRSCGCTHKDILYKQAIKNGIEKPLILSDKLNRNNTSGHKGVFWNTQKKKWHAKIKYNYKQYNLCISENINDCVKVRKEAENAVKEGNFEEWIRTYTGKTQ